MGRTRIAITMDERALEEIDRLVGGGMFASRSRAIESAVQGHLAGLRVYRLASECSKLNEIEEQALANEGYGCESQWAQY